jgi:hypothetical protein
VNRTLRLLLLIVVLITLTATAGALALGGEGEAADPEDANNPERVVGLLDNAGITTDASALTGLADTYGMGGAVRILAFADAAGVDPAEVTALRDAGMGWRQIARELGIDLGPGIGWIMNGHGQDQTDKDKGPGPGNGWGPGGNPNKPDEPEGE